jgi:hypothetical protein
LEGLRKTPLIADLSVCCMTRSLFTQTGKALRLGAFPLYFRRKRMNLMNLKLSGCGYLDTINDDVDSEEGLYPNASISVLKAEHDSTPIVLACRIEPACLAMISMLKSWVDAGSTVLIGFDISHLYLDTLVFKKSSLFRKGRIQYEMKAVLADIRWATVDGSPIALGPNMWQKSQYASSYARI